MDQVAAMRKLGPIEKSESQAETDRKAREHTHARARMHARMAQAMVRFRWHVAITLMTNGPAFQIDKPHYTVQLPDSKFHNRVRDTAHVGHNYIGHEYIGHHYIGHNNIGHSNIGHDCMSHNYIGHNIITNKYVGCGIQCV